MLSKRHFDRNIIYKETFLGEDSVYNNSYHFPTSVTAVTFGNNNKRKYGIFNGTTSAINTGLDWLDLKVCSISCWIYLNTFGEGSAGSRKGRIITNRKFTFGVSDANNTLFGSMNGGTNITTSANSSIATGTWYYVVLVNNSSNQHTFYINGSSSGTANQSTTAGGTQTNVIIGNDNAGSNTFDGFIANLDVYNYVLTANEISLLYKNMLYKDAISKSGLLFDVNALKGAIVDVTNQRTITNTSVTTKNYSSLNVMEFNGSTSKLDTGSDSIGITDITVSAWIYARSWGESFSRGRILDNGNFVFSLNNYTGESAIRLSSDGATIINSASNSVTLSRWYHVAVTRTTNGTANFYINGVLSGTANQNSGTPAAGTTNVIVGNNNGQTVTFDGYISRIRVWNRILSTEEITNLFSSSRWIYGV